VGLTGAKIAIILIFWYFFLLIYRGNVSPLGEKRIFGPLSKNNTGMVVLRAGLPVTKVQNVMLLKLSTL